MKVVLAVVSLLFASVPLEASTRVRHVQVKGDQIVVVRTALGVATIIQVPDKPNSVIVGDQEAFRIEYLDQAVTIKPLHERAKSNLYIYTDWRRFNAQLVTGSEPEADYVVYFDQGDIESDPQVERTLQQVPARRTVMHGIRWFVLHRKMKSEELSFELKRLGRTPDGVLVVEFTMSTSREATIKPEWVWVTQNKRTRPIQGLSLSSLEVKPGASVHGVIQLLVRDVETRSPLSIEIRRKGVSRLTIPKVDSWK